MTTNNNWQARDALESQILEINEVLGKAVMNPDHIKHALERQLRRHFIITDNEALDDFEEMLTWNLYLENEETKCSILRVLYNGTPFCLIVETYPENNSEQSKENAGGRAPSVRQSSEKFGVRIHSVMSDITADEAKEEFSEQMCGVDEVYYGHPKRLRIVWANTFWRAGDTRKIKEDQHVDYFEDDGEIEYDLVTGERENKELLARWTFCIESPRRIATNGIHLSHGLSGKTGPLFTTGDETAREWVT